MLVIHRETGSLSPLSSHLRAQVQEAVSSFRDICGNAPDIGYDSARHLIEVGVGVYDSMPRVISTLKCAISLLQNLLIQETGDDLFSSSYHPYEEMAEASVGAVRKPLYDLYRGPLNGVPMIHPAVLPQVYPTQAEKGRGWKLEASMLAAATQPWNSLTLESAADQLALMQATSWVFNLLTANSPFAIGRKSGKRDSRLQMWEQLMSTSRYSQDRALTRNLPARPQGLTDYYRHLYSLQRPVVVPYVGEQEGSDGKYRQKFCAVVQPEDQQEFTVLQYLQANRVQVVDIETGEQKELRPTVAHIFNGFDFLYYPQHGARLRVRLPRAEQIDARLFAQTILDGDEAGLRSLLVQGGILEGSICLEGRSAATVLPTQQNGSWKRFSIPFVLQTAILRAYREIWRLLEATPLTWVDLSEVLPELSNDTQHGFQTVYKGIHLTELAAQIWAIAQKTLSSEERSLVGDEIETIIDRQMAASEEQIAYVDMLLRDGYSMREALQMLVRYLSMEPISLSHL